MDVPERRVVKHVKSCIIDLSESSDHGFGASLLGFCPARGHVLVGEDHIPLVRMNVLGREDAAHRGVVVADLGIAERLLGQRGEDVGHKIEIHGTEFIPQCHAGDTAPLSKASRDVQVRSGKQLAPEGEPLPGVMVPGDHKDGDAQVHESGQEAGEKFHRVPRGARAVVDVPGDENRVRFYVRGERKEAVRPGGLVAAFDERDAVYGFSEVKVSDVQKFHEVASVGLLKEIIPRYGRTSSNFTPIFLICLSILHKTRV